MACPLMLGQNACLGFEDSIVLADLLKEKSHDLSSLQKSDYDIRFSRVEAVKEQDTQKCKKLLASTEQDLIRKTFEKSFIKTMASIKTIMTNTPLFPNTDIL